MAKLTQKNSLIRTPLFRNTFLSLFALALVIIMAFCALLSYSLQKSFRDEVASSSRYALERAGTAFENDLQWLAQDLGNMLWRSEFVDYMVLPSGRTLENESSIIQRLHTYAQSRLPMRELLFYAPLQGTYFSKDSSGTVDESYVPGLLNRAQQEIWSFWDESRSTRTTLLQGPDFFLFTVELRLGRQPTGVLYSVISEEALFHLLNSGEDGVEIHVVSGGQQPLLGSWDDPQDQDSTYSYTSAATGWTYLCRAESTALRAPVQAVLGTIIPIALLFLLVSAAFCYQISRWVYRPIEHLMELVRREEGTPAGSLELAHLEGPTAPEDYASISGAVRDVQPNVVPPLLRELSQGREIPPERVDEILIGVAAPFRSQGRFVLLSCAIQAPKDRLVTETERNLYMLAAQKLLAAAAEDVCFTLITSQQDRLLGLLAYPEHWNDSAVQAHLERLIQAASRASREQPFSILLEPSPVFHTLEQLGTQAAACQEALRSRLYDGRESGASEDLRRFSPAAKDFVQRALKGEREPAALAMQGALSEIAVQCGGDPERFDALAGNLLDAVTQQVVAANLGEEDRRWLLQTYSGRPDELKGCVSLEEKERFLLNFTSRLAGDLRQYGSKKQFQYIQSVKDFIAANYAQSNLSLNDVGESVGLSASYLSGLFKEYQKENFSAYLANYRVEQSKLLLTSTDLSVNSIGFACGFNSSQNYFRVFKKYVGMTPGQYRSEHKGKEGGLR